MKVLNVHERELQATAAQAGALINTLASKNDSLWPKHAWVPMKFDRPLDVGVSGGHGPVRYAVVEYHPGQSIRFRFTGPKGFDGFHEFEVIEQVPSSVILRHTIKMTVRGSARLSWPLLYRPLHDALLEDALATAQASLGLEPQIKQWSSWVKFLRRLTSRGKAPKQRPPVKASEPKI